MRLPRPIAPDAALHVLALVAVVLGMTLRAGSLGRAPMSHDEVLTAERAAGRGPAEMNALAYRGEVARAGDVAALLRPDAASHGPRAVVRSFLDEEPHHAPLFYVACWLWARASGGAIAELRALSLLAAFAAIAACFFLARELAGDARAGPIAAAVAALSPLPFGFALEARPHLAGLACLLWSSVFLVAAVRREEAEASPAAAWVAFALSLAATLYTYPAAGAGALALAVFAVAAPSRAARRRVVARFAIAAGAAGLAFAPWAANALARRAVIGPQLEWVAGTRSLPDRMHTWLSHLAGGRVNLWAPVRWDHAAVAVAALAAIALGLRLLPRRAAVFALALAASAVVPLGAADLLLGGHTSHVTRYILPSIAGFDLALALGIAGLLGARALPARIAGIVLLAATLASSGSACREAAVDPAPSTHWPASETLAVVRAAAERPDALLICTAEDGAAWGRGLALCAALPPRRRVLLEPPGHALRLPPGEAAVLVYGRADAAAPALAAAGFVERPAPPEAAPWLRAFEQPAAATPTAGPEAR